MMMESRYHCSWLRLYTPENKHGKIHFAVDHSPFGDHGILDLALSRLRIEAAGRDCGNRSSMRDRTGPDRTLGLSRSILASQRLSMVPTSFQYPSNRIGEHPLIRRRAWRAGRSCRSRWRTWDLSHPPFKIPAQLIPAEHINAHGRQVALGLLGLLLKLIDGAVLIGVEDAEPGSLLHGDLHHGDGAVCTHLLVVRRASWSSPSCRCGRRRESAHNPGRTAR